MTLDKSYTSKAEVANDVKEQLASIMAEFGYEIIAALVTDLEPDAKVKEAMNEINAAQRMREAALEKAEADKILVVKAAVSPTPSY
jgi:regulator of protease activity HflC (stomatin/prohibitin superfamily)